MGGHQNPKDRKLQTLIEVCTDLANLGSSPNIHRPAEQVFAVEEDRNSQRTCLLWRIDLHGLVRVTPILWCYNTMFTLAQKMGYEMRPIARRLDNTRQPSGPTRAPFTPSHRCRPPFWPGRDLGSSASVSVNSDILRLVARSQTRLFRINWLVRICNLIINNIRTSFHSRETLFRLGPHPYRSECNTLGLHFIFTP